MDEISDFFNSFERFFSHDWHMNAGDSKDKEDVSFWETRAADFACKAHSPEARTEVEEFLDQFIWNRNETVLDIGAGPGTFAIPISKRVSKVTAIDISERMLKELMKQAHAERSENIEVICGRWLEMTDIVSHDTVVCLNALGVVSLDSNKTSRLDLAIELFKKAVVKRLIILIPHADSPADESMRKALNLQCLSRERQRIAMFYMLMVAKGLLPDLKIIRRPFHWTFKDIDEAVDVLCNKLSIADPETRQLLRNHLNDRLQFDGQNYRLSYKVSQALYYWEKD